VLAEQLRGQSFELAGERYTIGRSEECDICIPDPTMSGRHCTLTRDQDGGYTVSDEGSTNGTRINGVRIDSQKLSHSDILQVGGVEVLYDCGEKIVSSSLSTQTQINLADTSGGKAIPEMANFSPFGSRGQGQGSGGESNKLLLWSVYGGIGLLVVIALVLLVQVILNIAST
jgi:pSer/pThr/pTyr-binding forkhead associated (FHA) protein